MGLLKRSVTVVLLLFVGATVGMLVAQAHNHPLGACTRFCPQDLCGTFFRTD